MWLHTILQKRITLYHAKICSITVTDSLINSLQNYYGSVIRQGKGNGNVQEMAKAVKATLLHCNSTDETPRHHLCPGGEKSWCK